MPSKDIRGHKVPSGTDPAARQSILDLSLSVPSVKTCASEAAANQHVSALAAAGVRATASEPVYVWRSDLSSMLVWDGRKWSTQRLLMLPAGQTKGYDPMGIQVQSDGIKVDMKHGYVTSTVTVEFGNGYMPEVIYDSPFSTATIHVSLMPIFDNGRYELTTPDMPMIDICTRKGFRVMYPRRTQPYAFSFRWMAFGC